MGYMIPPDITALEKIRKLALARTPNLVRQRGGEYLGDSSRDHLRAPSSSTSLASLPSSIQLGIREIYKDTNTIYKEQLTNYKM